MTDVETVRRVSGQEAVVATVPAARRKPELAVEVVPFDSRLPESHSGAFGDWLALFDADKAAPIALHPRHVLLELQFAEQEVVERRLAAGRLVLLTTRVRGKSLPLGGAVLLPRQTCTTRGGAFPPAKELTGFLLAGKTVLLDGEGTLLPEHLRGAITADEVRCRLAAAVLQQVGDCGAEFLMVEDLESPSPLEAAFAEAAGPGRVHSPTGIQQRHRIRFPATVEDWWAGFSAKSRQTLRRKQRKLGDVEVIEVRREDQVADFLEAAHEVSRRTWQSGRLGLRIRNDEQEQRLFGFLAARGALRSYLLQTADGPAAFLVGTQFRGVLQYEEVGYDPALSRWSPGEVLLALAVERMLADHPPEVLDFGGGHADYKARFGNEVSHSGTVWILPAGMRARLLAGWLRAGVQGRKLARQALQRAGVAGWLRRQIRRRSSAAS